MKKLLSVIIIIAMVCSISAPAFAASETWDGDQNTGVWATVNNWAEAGVVPGTGDTATFNSAGGTVDLLDLGGAVIIKKIDFKLADCAAYTIGVAGVDALTINDTGAITAYNGVVQTQTIAANVIMLGDCAFTNNGANDGFLLNFTGNITGPAAAKTLTLNGSDTGNNLISGVIANGVLALAVTKADAGKWVLSGINTYTGITTIGAGTLVATNSAAALGANATAAAVTMSGGKLQLVNDTALAFNRNTTVTASSEIDSARVLVAGAGVTHTLGTLTITGGSTLTAGIGDALTTSGVQGLTFGDVTLTALGGNAVIYAYSGGYGAGATGLLTLGNVTSNGQKLTLNSNPADTIAITMGTMADLGGAGNGLTITDAGGLVTVGTVGNGATGEVTITDSSNGVTFSGNVTSTTFTITDTSNDKAITFANGGTVAITTLVTQAKNYDVIANSTTFGVTADCNFLNTGTVTLGNGGDTITFAGGLDTTTGPDGTNIGGIVQSNNQQIDLNATTMTAASTLRSGTGAINVASITDGAGPFALSLGSVTQTGAITFLGNAAFDTLTTFANAYNIIFQGTTTTIDTDTTFLNTGITTLGNDAGDTTTFTGGLDTTACAGGTRIAGTVATTNTRMDLGATTLTAASSITSSGGVINIASVVNGGFLLTIDAGAGNSAIAGVIAGNGGLTKNGAGTLTLGGANTYKGTTTINAGIVDLVGGSIDDTGAVVLADAANTSLRLNGNERIGSLSGGGTTGGNVNLNGANTLTVGDVNNTTYSGIISGALGGITKEGAGTLILNGINTYTGTTRINAGTLQIGNGSALGTGAGGVLNSATLNIGSNTLNIIGVYTQVGGAATLMVDVNGTTTGSIVATGAATVLATDRLVLNVSNYVPNNTTYTIITGLVGGGAIAAPVITVTGDNRATFTTTTIGDKLIVTASRTANGFASNATSGDSNAAAVGAVLDNITNPSANMATVLATLNGLSASQTAAALDTLVPEVDAGVMNTSTAALNNFVGAVMERAETVLRLAQSVNNSGNTGVSTGDDPRLNGVWAKGYGSYLTQDTRKGIRGYDAWNAGTAIGADRLFADCVTLGISGGYAYGNVDSDVNNGNTYINSGQGTIYGGYQDLNFPYFINAAGSFAWNWYNGKRDINIGNAISSTANAQYDGQQYGAYVGGGYKFNLNKNLALTPLASLQWTHLHLASYTETEAGVLNLNAASQDYDILQSGIGGRLEYALDTDWGIFTPEVHGKWFYDFIGDAVASSSTFTGGGASFNTNGCSPAQSSFDVGGKLTLALKNDVTVTGECDTELKDQFFGIYGALTVRYSF